MKRLIASIGTVFMLATPAIAQTTYTCALKEAGTSNWIPEILFVGHDPATNKVVISDPIVHQFNNRQPIDGRVDTNNAKRVTFVWEVKMKDSRGQSARMQYRATWVKAAKRMNVVATPFGYANGFQGYGSCKVATR